MVRYRSVLVWVTEIVYLGHLADGVPSLVGSRVQLLGVFNPEMLRKQLDSEIMGGLPDIPDLPPHVGLDDLLILGDDTHLGIPLAIHTPVIDVGRPYNHRLIIHNHQFRVDIYNLRPRNRLFGESSMGPQAEELYVVLPVPDSHLELL